MVSFDLPLEVHCCVQVRWLHVSMANNSRFIEISFVVPLSLVRISQLRNTFTIEK